MIRSRTVIIEFDPLGVYDTNDFFYIDDFKVSHTLIKSTKNLVSNNELKIAASSFIYVSDQETVRSEPSVSSIEMAVNLFNAIRALNALQGEVQYEVKDFLSLRVFGKVHLTRKDGKEITLRIPKSYKLYIDQKRQ